MPNKEPYMSINLSSIGIIQFGMTLSLLTVSLANINNRTAFPEENTSKLTYWAMKNYKVTKTGIKYFNYSDPDTGETFDGVLSNSWFDERLKGKYVYYFGKVLENYCWPRETPASEWCPSLFRSGQLKPWVQVPLRAAILLGITFRFFQAIVFACMRIQQLANPESKIQRTLKLIFVLNELAHNANLFCVSNYLVTPDEKYFYFFGPALSAVYATFGIKMVYSVWHLGLHFITVLRLLLLILIAPTFLSNYNCTRTYLAHNYCDHYTTPGIALSEYCALLCLVSSELLDLIQIRNFECILGGSEDGYQDEDRVKNMARENLRITK